MVNAFEQLKDIWSRFSGRGTYPHQLSGVLLVPLRRLIFSPRQLVAQLHLTPTSRVLEVGPGPGFFSLDVARAVPRGRLELVDVQHEMLKKARRRLQRAGIGRVGFTQANAAALPFRPDLFDAAFLVAVLGEIPNPQACVACIAELLRDGGRLVFVELPGDPDAMNQAELRGLSSGTALRFVASERVGRATVTTFMRS
jgi:ubiquinone/menaquinone biosynthesis C-methylase UbiE